MSTPAPEPIYALFHVNRKTGERVRYPRKAFPATSKTEAEEIAKNSRVAAALVPSFTPGAGEWETQAYPDIAKD